MYGLRFYMEKSVEQESIIVDQIIYVIFAIICVISYANC